MRRSRLLALAVAVALAPQAAAEDLADLIPGLYGGDGITLGNPGHDAHFSSSTFEELNLINQALSEIPGNLPVGSSAASFTYEFNPATGVPERQATEGLGPIYAERARTLGGGLFQGDFRMSFAFQYTYIDFEEFEGDDLDRLRIIARHDDEPGDNAFENDVIVIDLDIDAKMHVFSFYSTLALLEWLDFAMVVPLMKLDLDVEANASIVDRGGAGIHFFASNPPFLDDGTLGPRPTDSPRSRGSDSAFGFGDVILRLKWRFLEAFKGDAEDAWLSDKMEFALLGQVKLPTGDEDDLLGTGDADWRLVLVASKTFEQWFEPHFNFGYEWNGTTAKRDAFIWAAGIGMKAIDEVTLFADLVGKKKRIGEGIGDNIVDVALGGKFNPFGNLIITPAVLIPLNEEGLRAEFIPSIALEYIF